MTHGDSLVRTTEATQRSLEERLGEALAPHLDPHRPRDNYATIDTFTAATSRHLAAIEAVLLRSLCATPVPGGEELEPSVPGRGSTAGAHARPPSRAGCTARRTRSTWGGPSCGRQHTHSCTSTTGSNGNWWRSWSGTAIRRSSTGGPGVCSKQETVRNRPGHIRAHPTPGSPAWVARRIWALADRFWDAAEGRVIPDPVRPAAASARQPDLAVPRRRSEVRHRCHDHQHHHRHHRHRPKAG